MLERLGAEWRAVGDGFSWDAEDLEASAALSTGRVGRPPSSAIASGTHDLVVLDEITYPMVWCWIDADAVVSAIATATTV